MRFRNKIAELIILISQNLFFVRGNIRNLIWKLIEKIINYNPENNPRQSRVKAIVNGIPFYFYFDYMSDVKIAFGNYNKKEIFYHLDGWFSFVHHFPKTKFKYWTFNIPGIRELGAEIEKKYNNVRCILSENNIGMGAGNNYGLCEIDTDYGFILNPDVVLRNDTIDEIILCLLYTSDAADE